jgi:hypothetical protein
MKRNLHAAVVGGLFEPHRYADKLSCSGPSDAIEWRLGAYYLLVVNQVIKYAAGHDAVLSRLFATAGIADYPYEVYHFLMS